jgi:hypothetical protein
MLFSKGPHSIGFANSVRASRRGKSTRGYRKQMITLRRRSVRESRCGAACAAPHSHFPGLSRVIRPGSPGSCAHDVSTLEVNHSQCGQQKLTMPADRRARPVARCTSWDRNRSTLYRLISRARKRPRHDEHKDANQIAHKRRRPATGKQTHRRAKSRIGPYGDGTRR